MKQGYKQTDIGLIPEDWDVIPFSKCFDAIKNNTLSRAELNYDGGNIRNIHYGDVLINFPSIVDCQKETIPYVNEDAADSAGNSFLQDGDIVIADTAEDNTVGKAVEIFNIGDSKVVAGLHTMPCRPKNKFADKYLGYYINARVFHDQIIPYITGTKVSSISKKAIDDTTILVPPLAEQKRIAEALSDVDELIASLEKLIEKKKALKQGAMQELLTGKRRLPGFTGEWKRKELSKIATMFAGGTPNTEVFEYYGGDIPWVSIADISNAGKYISSTQTNLSEAGLANSSATWYPANTILFAMYASIGKCCITTCPMTSSQAILGIYDLTDCNVGFLYYQLLFRQSEFMNLKQTGTQSNLSKDIIGKIIIYLPSIPEQEAISVTISDLDCEIDSLVHKLQKYYRLKSGMMSELLTGKIRLV